MKVFNIIIKADWHNIIKWVHYLTENKLTRLYFHKESLKSFRVEYDYMSNEEFELEEFKYEELYINVFSIEEKVIESRHYFVSGINVIELGKGTTQIIGYCHQPEFIELIEDVIFQIEMAWEIIRGIQKQHIESPIFLCHLYCK